MQETQGRRSDPWIEKILWSRVRQPTAAFLPAESCGQRGLAGCGPWVAESDSTDMLRVGLAPAPADSTGAEAAGAGPGPARPPCPRLALLGGHRAGAAQSQQRGTGVQAQGLQGGGGFCSVGFSLLSWAGLRPCLHTQPWAPPLCHARPPASDR